MKSKEILNQLASLGTEKNRNIYMRHGSGQDTYGVSFANLKKLAKGIGQDHELALELWETRNIDAQSLATLILDPSKMTMNMTKEWIKMINYSVLIGLLAKIVAKTNFALNAIIKWTCSKNEQIRACGFGVASHMLKNGFVIDSKTLGSLLKQIEMEIHHSPNDVRKAMNETLVAIRIYCEEFSDLATAIAKKI